MATIEQSVNFCELFRWLSESVEVVNAAQANRKARRNSLTFRYYYAASLADRIVTNYGSWEAFEWEMQCTYHWTRLRAWLAEAKTLKLSIDQMRDYTSDVFYYFCDAEFIAEKVEEGESEPSYEAQVLGFAGKAAQYCVRKFMDVVVPAVSGHLKNAVDYVVEQVERAVKAALGAYWPKLEEMYGFLTKAFSSIKSMILKQINTLENFFSYLEEGVVIALGIIAGSLFVALVERCLIGCGLIAKSYGAGQVFCGIALATSCGAASISYVLEKGSQDMQLLGALCFKSMCYLSDQLGMPIGGDAEGQAGPVDLLVHVADGLSKLTLGSLVDAGKVMASFSQIKSGILSLREIAGWCLDTLGGVADSVFGVKSKLLADLSTCVGQDVSAWLAECDLLNDHILAGKELPRCILDKLRTLLSRGRAMRDVVLSKGNRSSGSLLNVFNKALEKLQENVVAVELMGSAGTRGSPFCIFFTGEAGIGKTSVMQKVVGKWLEFKGLDVNDKYSRNTTDSFWSRYRRQAVVTYDDFAALNTEGRTSDEAELIKVVSRDPLFLNMAGIEEKGMSFDSRFVAISSNFLDASPTSKVHDRDAYQRRRHMVVRVERKPGAVYNPEAFWESQSYVLIQSKYPFQEIQRLDTLEELLTAVYNRADSHEKEEQQFLESLGNRDSKMGSFMEALLGMAPFMMMTAPENIKQIARKHPGKAFLGVVDNEAWFFDEFEVTRVALVGFTEADAKICEKSSQAAALQFLDILKAYPEKHSLAVFYCQQAVQEKWFNKNLEMREGLDGFATHAAGELPQWQRAIIYTLSRVEHMEKGYFRKLLDSWNSAFGKMFSGEVASWPMLLKICVGVVVAATIAYPIFYVFKWLCGLGSGPTFLVAATSVFVAQSEPEDKAQRTERMYGNKRIIQRRMGRAQANFGDSHAWIMDNCMAQLSYAGRKSQVCLLPGRRLVGVTHFLQYIPDKIAVWIHTSSGSYVVVWEKKNLITHPNSELSSYVSPMIKEVNSTVNDRVVWDPETLRGPMDICFLGYKYQPLTGSDEPEVGETKARICTENLPVNCSAYQVIIPKSIVYDARTENGDCGSLVTTVINGKAMLIGIHIAGSSDEKEGIASFVPPHPRKSAVAQCLFAEDFKSYEEPIHLGPNCSIVGAMKEEKTPASHMKTSFVAMPLEYHLGHEMTKQPSILSSSDPRLMGQKKAYNPLRSGMEKYAQEAGPFDQAVLSTVGEEIVETWYDAHSYAETDLGECSMQDAINGVEGEEYFDPLVMSTSEGYPYVLERCGDKGKSRYFQEAGGVLQLVPGTQLDKDVQMLEELCKTQVPELIGIECPKDERLPNRKVVVEPKTRLFTVLPVSYNLVVRKKFLNFVRFLMKSRGSLPCQVGINPYSCEWGEVASRLREKSPDILCCDYSRFDGFLSGQLMYEIANMIARFCGGTNDLYNQRVNLLMAAVDRYAIAGKIVYRVKAGIPSGFPLTVIVNSILNEVLVRYFYRIAFSDKPLMAACFHRFLAMVCYGDDNLIAVSPDVQDRFNGTFLKKAMAEHSITITDGVDKTLPTLQFRGLLDCDFLKRKFVFKDGQWVGPLEEASLWPQLQYVRVSHMTKMEAYQLNCVSVLRELYLHDVAKAKLAREQMRKLLGPMVELPTLAQLAAFHDEQKQGRLCWKGAQEFLLKPEWFENNPLKQGYVPLYANYSICDYQSLEKRDLDATVVRCGMPSNYKQKPGEIVIRYTVGSGRGMLPTKAWLDTNYRRKNSELRKALRNESKLVFSSPGDFTLALIFCVLFLVDEKKITLIEANHLLVVGPHQKSFHALMEYYASEFK